MGADSPDYFGQDWEEPYRARRLQEFFDAPGKQNLGMSAMMQADHLSLVAKDFLPFLLSLAPVEPRAQQALELLRGWDGVMDQDKPQPALFEAWLSAFHARMLMQKTGVDMHEKGPLLALTLQTLLSDHAQEWCGEAACRDVALASLNDALDRLTQRQGAESASWRWGRENISLLRHKLYSHIPVLRNISDLSVPSSGDFYTLDRGGGFDPDPRYPFARTHGGGFRGLYDLADPDTSLFMIATGESGHILSRHYGDLVPLWNKVEAVTLSGTQEDLRQSGADDLVLEP